MCAVTKYIIITSINHPTEAVARFSKWEGWQLIVIGDRKSPSVWDHEGVIYLGIEEQYTEFGALAKAIPENTYTRKMLGYIYAIRRGAKAIFDTDDDNLPYGNAQRIVEAQLFSNDRVSAKRMRSESGWLNIYKAFGAQNCWPRGFPLEYISDNTSSGAPGMDTMPWGVIQFLADEDPDVDAVYRMLGGDPVYFARDRQYILDAGTYCPINSQATLWTPETFPLLFLPLGIPDRVTDILRGYIALSCLWKTGQTVAFSSPVVYQERNAHNLFNDFQQEIPLYNNADLWSKMLLTASGNSVKDCYLDCIRKLITLKALPQNNIESYEMFLAAAGIS